MGKPERPAGMSLFGDGSSISSFIDSIVDWLDLDIKLLPKIDLIWQITHDFYST